MPAEFDGLDRYSTIVADPPWHYAKVNPDKDREGYKGGGLPYSTMTVEQVAALPIASIAEPDCRVWLWITNKYLRHGWDILEAWGAKPAGRVFVWTKKPRATTPVTTEYLMTGSMGRATPPLPWLNSTWFDWPRAGLAHSQKPPAALDLIESVSPGPYVELFARAPRLGWDSWGKGYEGVGVGVDEDGGADGGVGAGVDEGGGVGIGGVAGVDEGADVGGGGEAWTLPGV